MKMSRGTALVWLLVTEWARADIVVRYDAGTSGSPASPTNYLFTHDHLGGSPWDRVITPATGITNSAVTNDLGSGFNAWNVSDNATVSGGVLFTNPIASNIDAAATNAGWTLRARVRMVSDFSGSSDSCFVEYGTGPSNPRYLIFFGLDANNNLTVQLQGLATRTLTTNGQGNAAYHLHEIVYSGGKASYYFDGQLITNNWTGFVTATSGNGVRFGSGSTTGKGSMNYNLVEWEINATKPEASLSLSPEPSAYLALVYGHVDANGLPTVGWFQWGPTAFLTNTTSIFSRNPTDEVDMGWWLEGLGPTNLYSYRLVLTNLLGISTSEIGQFITPFAFEATTLPVTTLEPHQATLSGSINPSGLAATGWFEWGTTTNYGNQTLLRNMGNDLVATNITQLITGLNASTTYHYRCVASNVQHTVFGQNRSFTTPPVFIVTNLANAGAGSLRQSIANALAGDTITFGVTGTVVLASELLITKNLTVTGATPALISLSGNNAVRVLTVTNGVNVSISGLSIRNGRTPNGANSGSTNNPGLSGGDGGGIFNRGTLTLSNCVITANTTGTGGGGFRGSDTGSNGGLGGDGGGIYNIGHLTMTACTVRQNSNGTGGLGPDGTDAGTKIGGGNGGDAGSGGSGGNGGGIYNGGTLILDNCTVSMNVAGRGGDGGQGGTATASVPPGIAGLGGSGGDGSAIYNMGALTLRNVTISGNTAGRGGNGGGGAPGGGLGGGARGAGSNGGNGGRGAIYNSGFMGLGACTISENTTGLGGTGGNSGNNSASVPAGNGGNGGDAGGILNAAGASASLRSTIVALNINSLGGDGGAPNGNSGLVGFAPDLKGSFTTEGHNFIGKNDGNASFIVATGATGDQIGSIAFPINPLLGPLTNRGGLTATRSLLTGSPARDAGDDALAGLLSGDQRGYARLSGAHVDIGAFEVQVVSTNNRPQLMNPVKLSNGAFQFSFTNVPGAEFTVLTTTNLALPLSSWTLTTLAETAPGQFQFTDTTGITNRFYLVRWP